MSRRAEKVLIGLLCDQESIEVLMREGLPEAVMPTPDLYAVVRWAMDYYTASAKAPTVMALNERWADLLADNEVALEDEPQESVEWVLQTLQGTYVRRVTKDLMREFATDIATCAPEDRLEVMTKHSGVLSDTVEEIATERNRRDSVRRRLLDLDGLLSLTPTEPLIPEVIDQRSVTLLYGASGSGKSFLALDWALSVATGSSWFGRPVKQGRVLWLAGEGVAGMPGRVLAWRQHHHRELGPEDLKVLPIGLPLAARTGRRGDDDKGARQRAELRRVVTEGEYSLVVVDTVARYSLGLEENSNSDMGEFVDAATRLADLMSDQGGTVLLVHHSGKSGPGERGASSLRAGVDMAHEVTGDSKESAGLSVVRTVARVKAKDAETFHKFAFRLETVPLYGRRDSAVPVQADISVSTRSRLDERVDAALRLLEQGPVNARNLRDGAGVRSKDWEQVRAALLDRGVEFVATQTKAGKPYGDGRGTFGLTEAARRRLEVMRGLTEQGDDHEESPDHGRDDPHLTGHDGPGSEQDVHRLEAV